MDIWLYTALPSGRVGVPCSDGGFGAAPPRRRGLPPPNPLLLWGCTGESDVPWPAKDGEVEGGEVLAQLSAAECVPEIRAIRAGFALPPHPPPPELAGSKQARWL